MGLQADTIIGAFRIRYLADAVKKLEWISIYVILFLKKKTKHIKTPYVSSENSDILKTEFTCVCFVFFFTRAQEFCRKAKEILQ